MSRAAALLISILVTTSFAASARGQADVIDEPPSEGLAAAEDVARLDRWLSYLSGSAKRGRITSGTTSLIASGIVMGTGIWAFLQTSPTDELTRGAGFVAVAGSGALMSVAIFQLAAKSQAEETLERWHAATAGELTLTELARFEGELRQYTETMNRGVRLMRWTDFGIALTGALILGLTPAADLSPEGARTGYVTGGVALGAGLLGFALTFVGQSKTDHWNAYLQGKDPPSSPRWSASPQVGRTFAGLRVAGRF